MVYAYLTSLLIIMAMVFAIWFFKLLIKAVKINAIKGFWDMIITVILWFLGIIFAIIYLKIKINKKLKSPDKEILKKRKNKIEKTLDKFWYLLWKDNSLKGWIFSVIILFIFIKLTLFPGLNLITGTELPLAIVESCSMYHKNNLLSNYNVWWEEHSSKYENYNINKVQFERFIFKRGFNKGDILFVLGANPEKLKVGDVIIFEGGRSNPLIHRIIKITKTGENYSFSTIGDNNNGQLIIEKDIKQEQLIGKAVFKLAPYIGWGKLIFFEPFRPSSERGFCQQN